MRLQGLWGRNRSLALSALVNFLLLLGAAPAQEIALSASPVTPAREIDSLGSGAAIRPEPPASATVAVLSAPEKATHTFWDRKNLLLFSAIAATRALDYASTRNFEARGRQEILLPQDVVDNSAAFAGIEVAGAAASVGVAYGFHRTGHHTMERWFSLVHIGATAFGDARNYALKSRHRHY